MTDREERQHVIEVLKSWDGYFIGYTSDEVQEALRYAIASIKTDLKYDLLYEETSGQTDKPTTKNDLGVDWESYKDVDGNSLDDLILEVLQNNFDCGNTYGYKVADEIIGLLPSVTPQEPILDKIRAEIESDWQLKKYPSSPFSCGLRRAIEVIDKYKAESEG